MKNKHSKGRNTNKQVKPSRRERDIESLDMRDEDRIPKGAIKPDRRGSQSMYAKPNDWRWYAQNEQLMRDYASYPFSYPVGTKLKLGIPTLDEVSVPGLMAIYFVPSIGWAQSEADPINVAMRRVYSYVRHANSGASNYDAPDLMMYLIAVDSAYMFLSYMKRMYGVMLDYTPYNRYYPRILISANQANFSDLESNLNDFRGYINQFAVKLNQLWIPNSMSYMARHAWMCEGMYTDSPSAKAQTYMFVPSGFYQFALSDGVGSLEFKRVGTPYFTLDSLIAFGNALLNPLITNEDMGIMGGDILKAFGSSGVVKAEGITSDYKVLPIYSEEVLSQIENLSALGTVSGNDITQLTSVGTGQLQSKPVFRTTVNVNPSIQGFTSTLQENLTAIYGSRLFLNMHHADPTPADVMVATRLSNIPSDVSISFADSTATITGSVKTAASEIVERCRIFQYVTNASGVYDAMSYGFLTIQGSDLSVPYSSISEWVKRVKSALSVFDWHPIVKEFFIYPNPETVTEALMDVSKSLIGDADYYTYLDDNNLWNMSTAALLSELTIPQLG